MLRQDRPDNRKDPRTLNDVPLQLSAEAHMAMYGSDVIRGGTVTDDEIARQATEERRRREAYQQAEAERRAEYERHEAERRHEMALAERKQYADQVTNSVQRAEEDARRKAEWERQQREAREREEEAREQARVEQRLARERARLGVGNSSY